MIVNTNTPLMKKIRGTIRGTCECTYRIFLDENSIVFSSKDAPVIVCIWKTRGRMSTSGMRERDAIIQHKHSQLSSSRA